MRGLPAWTALLAFGCVSLALAESRAPVLDLENMTFVASQGDENQVTVEAGRANLDTVRDVASLVDVRAAVSDESARVLFEMTCLRGELDLATSDFVAEGDVAGKTAEGTAFAVDWLRYDHEKGVLYTDSPVVITEEMGTYRGGGFRYDVRARRFRLFGGATMVQEP